MRKDYKPKVSKELERELKEKHLKPLLGKRVEVTYEQRTDYFKNKGTKRGWLLKDGESYILLAKRNSRRGQYLTFGWTDGFRATLTIKEIREVETNQKPIRKPDINNA